MRRSGKTMFGLLVTAALLAVLLLAATQRQTKTARAAAPSSALAPVESDMHEFMEYVFQPTYKRLQANLAAEPADRAAWKPIKSDALILAEGGNLLLARIPDEEVQAWVSHSVAVRKSGGELYEAAKKGDYQAARQKYVAMLERCNRCHDDFADGEHQLQP